MTLAPQLESQDAKTGLNFVLSKGKRLTVTADLKKPSHPTALSHRNFTLLDVILALGKRVCCSSSDEKLFCNNTKKWKEFSPSGLPLFTFTAYNYFYAYIRGVHLSSPTNILPTLQFHKQMFRCRFLNYEINFEVTLYCTVVFQITSENSP